LRTDSRGFSSFLDASRWIAAFLVVVSHVRHLLLVDLPAVVQPSMIVKGLYFISGFGHEAVVVFFVISGFLVGGSTLERWQREGPALQVYALARVSRIYTVFIPALLVSLALDLTGATWFDSARVYSQPAIYHTISLMGPLAEHVSGLVLLGNLAMLQTIAVPVLGTNGPLWSLAYEWWYYWIFMLVGLASVKPNARNFVVAGVILALLALAMPANLIFMGVLWLIGIILFFVVRSATRLPSLAIGFTVFAGAMVWSRLSHNLDNVNHLESPRISFERDFIVALGYSALACSMSRTTAARFSALHKTLADFSYSTYLVHFPMLLFAAALLKQQFGLDFVRQPSLWSFGYAGAMIAFLYAYAYGFATLTERHTDRVRAFLKSCLRTCVQRLTRVDPV